MSNWFENHQLQRKQISTVGNVPYIQSSNHGLQCYTQPLVFRAYSFNSCNIQGNIQAFRLTRLFSWQKLTWFFTVFSWTWQVELSQISQFNSDFAVSFHSTRSPLSQVWQWRDCLWTNHNSLLRIATNEIVSFCIDDRLGQMALFVFAEVGKGHPQSPRGS